MIKNSIAVFLLIILLFHHNLVAKEVEKHLFNFPIESTKLLQGQIHYFYKTIPREEIKTIHPKLFKLDFANILKGKKNKIILGKTTYIVNQPISYFENKNLIRSGDIFPISKNTKIKEIRENTYQMIDVNDSKNFYELKTYYDSDDVCTLPNSKLGQAVQIIRELDIISKGASMIMIAEQTNRGPNQPDHLIFHSFIPVRENKTLIIRYDLSYLNLLSSKGEEKSLSFHKNLESIKNLIKKE